MKHPNSETWAAYLAGDLPKAEQITAADHLKTCPECAAQITQWKAAIDHLERWRLPRRNARSRSGFPILKWAAAAIIVLGLTFVLGRISTLPATDLDSVRAALAPELKGAVISEIETKFRQEWADRLVQQIAQSADDANARLRNDLLRTLRLSSELDQKAVLTLIERLKSDMNANYLSLRKDLETVASLTDSQIQQARLGLIRLAGSNRSENGL